MGGRYRTDAPSQSETRGRWLSSSSIGARKAWSVSSQCGTWRLMSDSSIGMTMIRFN